MITQTFESIRKCILGKITNFEGLKLIASLGVRVLDNLRFAGPN
jgi:hypothetical protein